MNPRSFTMGIGTGIIVACLILGAFYRANKAHWNAGGAGVAGGATEATNTEAPTQTIEPTATPTIEPTAMPTTEPTTEPTTAPTVEPTATPTIAPTEEPTAAPTTPPPQATEETPEPTAEPTPEPTLEPTAEPTTEPTLEPTPEPTLEPTTEPTPAQAGSAVSVYIPQHATAAEVARLLRDSGVISDSEAFVRHLINAGVTQRIWYGTFRLSPEMGFDELTAVITKSPY